MHTSRPALLIVRSVLAAVVAISALGISSPPAAAAGECSVTVATSGRVKTTAARPSLRKSRIARSYTDLQQALDSAPSGATINVGGICSPSADSSGSFEITTRRLRVIGDPTGARLEGNGQQPVIRVASNASVELRSVTIAFGGGAYGAGVSNRGSTTLRGTTVTNNRALGGGGGVWNEGVMVLDGSTVSHNLDRNGRGGGIYNIGRMTIDRSAILNNSSYDSGGGLYNIGNVKVSVSTISGNTTRRGGGITNESSGTLVLHRSIISQNTAYDEPGGGIANLGGTVVGGCPPSTSYVDNSAPADPSTDDHVGIDCN